jgi:hypothetical protein
MEYNFCVNAIASETSPPQKLEIDFACEKRWIRQVFWSVVTDLEEVTN